MFVKQTKTLNLISWLEQPTSKVMWPVPNLPGMPKFEKGSSFSIAPSLGQHTKEIMLDNGYSIDKINKLINDGVIK